MENTSTRLKKIMDIKNLKQVDLLELVKPYCEKYNVKMNKSDISQYLSNKTKPNQEKLAVLSMALGVTESWLMGFDVPMQRAFSKQSITKEEKLLLDNYNSLNNIGKEKLLDYSNDLIGNVKYIYKEPTTMAAHDDDLTDEEKEQSLNIALKAFEEMKKNK